MTAAGSAETAAAESWRVPAERAGERLDRALAELAGVARSRVQAWIRAGRVEVDGRAPAKAGEALRAGARLSLRRPPPAPSRVLPEPGELAILYEDADLVVLDKPAGLVVHPGAGRRAGTLVHRLLARYPDLEGVGGPGRPGIVHRLDRETSGVLAIARNEGAYRTLTRAFAGRAVAKRYLAIVRGRPRAAAGQIDAPIARHPTERKRMAVRAGGRAARTGWRVAATVEGATLLEIDLFTGRTHQIRVHLKHAGIPLVGDPVYGGSGPRGLAAATRRRLDEFPRPALHARRLELAHPRTGELVRFEAPVPADLDRLWRELGGRWPPG